MEAQFSLSIALIIFFADAFYWFLTVFLIDNVVDNKPAKAGFFAAALNFSAQLAVYYFVKNFDYMIPACAGAFIGAVLATAYDRRKQKNQNDELEELRRRVEKLEEGTKRIEKFPQKVIRMS